MELDKVLTGDRPTGKLHIGHYIGSLKTRIEMQSKYPTYILVADVQALTDNYDNPEKIRENILETTIDNLAVGVDPNKATFFIQSMIPQIAELTIFFMNLVTKEQVLRNPTVKEEVMLKRGKFLGNPPFGFLAYPVSQAADILFLRANKVPVGDDQKPMIELANDIAQKFNKIYQTDIFPTVEGVYSECGRLVGLDGAKKMSKSLGNTIFFDDSDEEITRKIMGMYTDPNRIRATDPGKVEGNPVFIYHDLFNPNKQEVEDLKDRYRKGQVGDVEVKRKLIKAMIDFISPIRERRINISKDRDYVWDILQNGIKKVQIEAEETMAKIKEAMKINYLNELAI